MKLLPSILGVLAVVSGVVAWKPISEKPEAAPTGSDLFTKPAAADVIDDVRVAEWDEPTSSAKIIEIKRSGNDWSIASHLDYPGDANVRVSKLTATYMGLTHGRLVTDDTKQFAALGVIDPLDPDLSQKEGRGKRITMTDITGQVVADLIIGKKADIGDGLVYMREVGKNQVYTAQVAPDLSTKFVDYVETDPLKVKREDIRSLLVADYSIDAQRHAIDMRSETQLVRPTSTDQWSDPGPVPPDKRVAQGVINTIITAATTIKLTDVRQFSIKSIPRDILEMQSKGFYFVPPGTVDKDSPVLTLQGQELAAVGNEGRLTISTRDGLRYSLMFGEVAVDADGKSQDPAAKDASGAAAGRDRYMLVFVAYDPSLDEDAGKPPGKDEKPKLSGAERAARAQARYQKYYYVISDEAFMQLRPGLDKLFEAKPPEAKVGTTGKTISEWMADNGKRPGVTTTASGLQYQVLTPAPAGAVKPGPSDTVAVRYRGTLVDGTVFDASKAEPTTFSVNGVVKGFGEGLQLMGVGAKYRLFIRPELGYGESAVGKIPASSILTFDVELVSVGAPKDLSGVVPSIGPNGQPAIQAHLVSPTPASGK